MLEYWTTKQSPMGNISLSIDNEIVTIKLNTLLVYPWTHKFIHMKTSHQLSAFHLKKKSL